MVFVNWFSSWSNYLRAETATFHNQINLPTTNKKGWKDFVNFTQTAARLPRVALSIQKQLKKESHGGNGRIAIPPKASLAFSATMMKESSLRPSSNRVWVLHPRYKSKCSFPLRSRSKRPLYSVSFLWMFSSWWTAQVRCPRGSKNANKTSWCWLTKLDREPKSQLK